MKVYVGVDWSATEASIAAAGDEGEPRSFGTVAVELAAVRRLVDRIRKEFGADEVLVIIEDGAEIWCRLFEAAQVSVRVVDTKQSKRFAESLGSSGAKDDRRDARTLVELGRSRRHLPEPWVAPDDAAEQLERLSARRERLVEERCRETQRLREDLRRSMPLVNAVIEDVELRWVRRLLKAAPTAWHMAALVSSSRIEETLKGANAATVRRALDAARRTEAPWLTAEVAELEATLVHQALERLELLAIASSADSI